jgi:hypothetical protein
MTPLPEVAGMSLDGTAPYVISDVENRQLCETMGIAPDPGGAAHPIYYYIATQVGMSLTVAGLCAACAFDVNDGPMLANSKVAFLTPMRTLTPYFVKGAIVGLTRKPSKRLGVMDLLDYRLSLVTETGEVVLESAHLWVLPRGAHA